jgi:hypothetical protein
MESELTVEQLIEKLKKMPPDALIATNQLGSPPGICLMQGGNGEKSHVLIQSSLQYAGSWFAATGEEAVVISKNTVGGFEYR